MRRASHRHPHPVALVLLLAAVASAQDVTRLGDHADPSRCVDIVFIGDGFTDKEQDEFDTIVERMAANFTTPPFDVHADRVNLYRINLVSPQSGIATDANPVTPPLGGTVAKFVGGKLLRCDVPRVLEVVREAVPDVDYILVVLNTHGKFLGSANTGRIVRLSTSGGHQRSIVVHEFGHNFVGLVDEYVDAKQSGAGGVPPRVKLAPNADLEKNVHLAKWHHWNIPEAVFRGRKRGKPFKWEDNVRCYEGGATYLNGVYRAEENCHMQRGRGKAYCRVCAEATELGLYRFFAPVESVTPARARVSVKANNEFTVRPIALRGETGTVRVAWYVDGRRVPDRKAKGFSLRLRKTDLKGKHHVTVTVNIDSPRVHMDRGRLSATFTWTLAEGAPAKQPERRKGIVGEPIAITETFSWTPEKPGAYSVAAPDGPTFHVAVKPATKRSNKGPKLAEIPAPEGREGQRLEFALLAEDPDGDHLLWTTVGLPEGAVLDANTGRVVWDVGHSQRGDHEIAVEVTDGAKKARRRVRCRIEGTPLFRGIFRLADEPPERYSQVDWMLVGLHHPNLQVRVANARRLQDAPGPTATAEALRFLRDPNPELATLGRGLLARLVNQAPLDMFLDEMPRRVWQFVDRPKLLAAIRDLIKAAAARPQLDRHQKKALEALRTDLDRIDKYNEERRTRPAPPPITDKKHR